MSRVEFLSGDPVAPTGDASLPMSNNPEPESDRVGRPYRLGPRSLTFKIVTGVVGLVVLLLAAIGSTTYFTQRSFLYGRLDQQVGAIASSNADTLTRCFKFALSDCLIGGGLGNFRAPAPEWVTQISVYGKNLGGVEAGDSLEVMRLTTSQAEDIARDPSAFRTVTTSDGRVLRVTAQAVPQSQIIVVSGLSTYDVRKNLSRLVFVELLVGVLAVLIAVLATTYGVRFSLRHLRRVTTTAQEVAEELSPEGAGLDRRVPDDEPDTEVGQLATSFNTMLAAVETQFAARVESETRMRQFMADASHELRTPLTSIRGYAELARMQRAAGDTSDDNLDRIESEGTRMSRLVEDLLMLARGDAEGADRPARRELLEAEDVVDDSVRGSRAAFAERQIDMEVLGAPQMIGDRDQLVRVIRNLVNNAAVHTAPGRPILVRAWGDDANVTIQVVDGGPGLAYEDAAHVFERFWRADKARTRARGGSGLGLSIVATIVRAHGGTVRFDSTVETGSTVTVTLPAAQSAAD